jgi:hypothetical protein
MAWDGVERRTLERASRADITPEHLRDVLSALVQHIEEEDAIGRSVVELRGSVGSISGELAQMKEASVAVTENMTRVSNGLADLRHVVQGLGTQIECHLKQAQPIIEASESVMVLAKAGSMIWRLKWAALGVGLLVWAMLRGDMPGIVKAFSLIFTHTPP